MHQSSQITQIETPILKRGVYLELDNLLDKYDKNQAQLNTIRTFWERQMSPNSTVGDFVKLCSTEKNHITLQMTKTRCNALKEKMKNSKGKIELENNVCFEWGDVSFVPCGKTNMEIRFPLCSAICHSLGEFQTELSKMTQSIFIRILNEIESEYMDTLEKCCEIIAKIDVLFNKSYIAEKYCYCRPQLNGEADKSFVHAYGLRHILIEQINTNEIYVTNDVLLGKEEDINGMLLFGTNTVGKTSMMRALGISIILAQAGMYVPCTQFLYKPYKSIFSRIINQDNLFKGLSTFALEMSELRVILQYADQDSLILGDELCSGTESVSALSIMMSSLIHLHTKKSTFLFATHFHEIVDFEELHVLDKIKCFHLTISYDPEQETLVYDRKLKEGSGPRSYGLEICESLFMDKTFLEKAYEIRRMHFPEYEGSLSQPKTRYNAQKIKGGCEMCGKISEEIHHLQEQVDADEKGFINGEFHKNHVANLMSLCESCHLKMHHPKDDISPLSTSTSTEPKRRIVKKKTTKGYVIK